MVMTSLFCSLYLLSSIALSCSLDLALGDLVDRAVFHETNPPANHKYDVMRRLNVDYWSLINEEVTEEKLQALAQKHRHAYKFAAPFPHMVASDIFPRDVLDAINQEIPDNPPNDGNGCVQGRFCFNDRVYHSSKSVFDRLNTFGPATYALFTFMQSPNFVNFLEEVTGIEDLIVDKELYGGGIHQTLPKGYLHVHADFNKRNNLRRRVNVFLYMNPDWKDEYGGHLELWSRDLQRCEARVSPDLGKLVIFSTTDFSYHGHQTPLTCPNDRSRRSLALYYYTKTRPVEECREGDCDAPPTTDWQVTACPDCSDQHKCYKSTA